MKHIIKVESLENLPSTRPLIAMDNEGNLFVESLKEPELYIDLELPSGTLWAQGNIVKDEQGNYSIGARTDYGCYFSWGNVDGYNVSEIGTEEGKYSFSTANYNNSLGKQLTASIPSNDAEHDAAVACLGNGWHMPTRRNYDELLNSEYCSWENVSLQAAGEHVLGKLITSKINNKTIFLPDTGNYSGSTLNDKGIRGRCWTSTIYSDYSEDSLCLTFDYGNRSIIRMNRYYGQNIRPVM